MANPLPDSLLGSLMTFTHRVNENLNVRRILREWHPTVIVDVNDAAQTYCVAVDSEGVARLSDRDNVDDGREPILVSGSASVLEDVFAGRMDPSVAMLNGHLSVFADDRDQFRLDAVFSLLW